MFANTLGLKFAALVVESWKVQLRNGATDIVYLIPMEMIYDRAKPQQAISSLFTRKDRPIAGHRYFESLKEAREILAVSMEDSAIRGLMECQGWKFNQRWTDEGMEVRPGLAWVIATLGHMPSRNMVTRLADQGPGKEDRPKLAQWRKGRKEMEAVQLKRK